MLRAALPCSRPLSLLAPCLLCVSVLWSAAAGAEDPLRYFAPDRRQPQVHLEAALAALPSAASLRAHHDLLSGRPHPAATPGDAETIEWLVDAYQRLGLPVERQELFLYLPRPVRGSVSILSPVALDLAVQEPPLESDPSTAHPGLDPAWAGYSGNGVATGQVVYANYARREDFQTLSELGVRVDGRIVVARYGKLYRGNKAANAEAAGAAGLILYTDPDDAGYRKGIPYPEGGWLNEHSIERGSLLTLPYPGDPLTPSVAATREAPRRDPGSVAFPSIPVQPVGWGAAQEILSRMRGPGVPEGWQGGLPFAYRVSSGPELTVQVEVEQERALRRTENVIATLYGTRFPDQMVIIGCHHDAWSFGASDPNAGSIVLYEVARSFMELARRGIRTRRTLVFAHWGAEELGIQGSTEWVEANLSRLAPGGIAYVNLDSAALGTELSAAVSPSLQTVLREVMADVPQPGAGGSSVLDAWVGASEGESREFSPLGGGSDHVGFYAHAAIPAAGISSRGAPGSAYHTNYDTLSWYRRVVGDDYRGAIMLTRVVGRLAARLANADVVPLDPRRYAGQFSRWLDPLENEARELGLDGDLDELRAVVARYSETSEHAMAEIWQRVGDGTLTPEGANGIAWEMIQLERLWSDPEGLVDRPWYRNLFAATDPHTGYGAWMLPALRHAVEDADAAAWQRATDNYLRVFRLLEERMRIVARLARPEPASPSRRP